MAAHRVLMDVHKANAYFYIADPGNAGTIGTPKGVDRSPAYCSLVSAGAETRTLGAPTVANDEILVYCKTAVGTITMTVTGGIDQSATATYSFTAAGQWVLFKSVYNGTTYTWMKVSDYAVGNILPATLVVLNTLTALTATAAELNATSDVSLRVVATTSTQVSVTAAAHGDRDLVLNSTHTTTCTLPVSSGSGNRYTIIVGVTGTDGSKIIQVANTTDVIQGASIAANTQSTTIGFITTSGSDTITFNNTTQGGLLGTKVTILDAAAGVYLAQVFTITTGNPATPFSNAV